MQNKLSIILPVFNEKESLAIMVRLIKSTLKFENEILIVYDNLNDNCVEEAKKLEKEIPNVRAVHNDIKPGVRFAIEKGFTEKYENGFEVDTTRLKKEIQGLITEKTLVVGHLAPYVFDESDIVRISDDYNRCWQFIFNLVKLIISIK